MTTHTRTITAVIAESTSNTAGSTTRGRVDARGMDAGWLHIKLTNGGTGPTVQAEARILLSDTDGTQPAAASAGTDWKTAVSGITAGTAANAVREYVWYHGPGMTHIEVEVTGNTGQTVTCEATYCGTVLS
ncbi:MAG: hypothetical protein RJA36_3643 [Pseudomonadota bacterium]|jgi:hypothetical protein